MYIGIYFAGRGGASNGRGDWNSSQSIGVETPKGEDEAYVSSFCPVHVELYCHCMQCEVCWSC